MNCSDIENQDSIEKYLTGALSEAERERLEEHLLTCEACQDELEEMALLRTSLGDERWAVGEEPRASWLQWPWAWAAAAAAALALGLGLVFWLAPWVGPPPDQALIAASMVEAPPYEPRTLRSVTGDAEIRFHEAMQQYLEGSYARAIPGLEAAVELDPSLDKARFYLGACYLLEDEPKKAIDSLSRVAELEGSPYREWAHFYRAKAHLRVGDLDSALSDLSEVISVGGELQPRARGGSRADPRLSRTMSIQSWRKALFGAGCAVVCAAVLASPDDSVPPSASRQIDQLLFAGHYADAERIAHELLPRDRGDNGPGLARDRRPPRPPCRGPLARRQVEPA